jgi:hypothetical protein
MREVKVPNGDLGRPYCGNYSLNTGSVGQISGSLGLPKQRRQENNTFILWTGIHQVEGNFF